MRNGVNDVHISAQPATLTKAECLRKSFSNKAIGGNSAATDDGGPISLADELYIIEFDKAERPQQSK